MKRESESTFSINENTNKIHTQRKVYEKEFIYHSMDYFPSFVCVSDRVSVPVHMCCLSWTIFCLKSNQWSSSLNCLCKCIKGTSVFYSHIYKHLWMIVLGFVRVNTLLTYLVLLTRTRVSFGRLLKMHNFVLI